MLKHSVTVHKDVLPEKIEFRMKILSKHKIAFERQITEAVRIRNQPVLKLLVTRYLVTWVRGTFLVLTITSPTLQPPVGTPEVSRKTTQPLSNLFELLFALNTNDVHN